MLILDPLSSGITFMVAEGSGQCEGAYTRQHCKSTTDPRFPNKQIDSVVCIWNMYVSDYTSNTDICIAIGRSSTQDVHFPDWFEAVKH